MVNFCSGLVVLITFVLILPVTVSYSEVILEPEFVSEVLEMDLVVNNFTNSITIDRSFVLQAPAIYQGSFVVTSLMVDEKNLQEMTLNVTTDDDNYTTFRQPPTGLILNYTWRNHHILVVYLKDFTVTKLPSTINISLQVKWSKVDNHTLTIDSFVFQSFNTPVTNEENTVLHFVPNAQRLDLGRLDVLKSFIVPFNGYWSENNDSVLLRGTIDSYGVPVKIKAIKLIDSTGNETNAILDENSFVFNSLSVTRGIYTLLVTVDPVYQSSLPGVVEVAIKGSVKQIYLDPPSVTTPLPSISYSITWILRLLCIAAPIVLYVVVRQNEPLKEVSKK